MDLQRGVRFKTIIQPCQEAVKAIRTQARVQVGQRLLVFLFLLPLPAVAASYYVTQSGAGSQNGSSPSNAWSVSAFNSSRTPSGGDTVNFSGNFSSTVTPATSGTGNGTSRLTLNFAGATFNSGAIVISGCSYLNINGGTFATGDTGSSANGALIDFNATPSHDITVNGWTFTGTNTGTTDFISCYYCYNLTVTNNHMDNICHFILGDSTLNHDLTIQGNYARSNVNTSVQTDIITIADAYNVTISSNQIIHRTPGAASVNHNDCIQTYEKGGSNAAAPTNWTVCYNWIELQVYSGSGDNSWMMMENMGGTTAIQIYGNVFVGTGPIGNNGVCFDSNSSGSNFYFYNNTIIRHAGPDNTVRFLSPGTIFFRNNVMEADAGVSGTFVVLSMTAGSAWDYNFFYNATPQTDCAGPHGSTTKNPLFNNYAGNDFSLSPSSPLIGAADKTIGTIFGQGIVQGSVWPGPTLVARSSWDVGAYQSGLTPPQPQNLRISAGR